MRSAVWAMACFLAMEERMNERIIIRHMSGGKPAETEEFPVSDNKELAIGREPDCKIRFDDDKEDLVSRRHARITIEKTESG